MKTEKQYRVEKRDGKTGDITLCGPRGGKYVLMTKLKGQDRYLYVDGFGKPTVFKVGRKYAVEETKSATSL